MTQLKSLNYKNNLTLCFMDESDYKNFVEDSYTRDIHFTNKHDAIKIMNTVLNILDSYIATHDVWTISFACTPHRFPLYQYSLKKYGSNFISLIDYKSEDNLYVFNLFNKKHYKKDAKEKRIIRLDNGISFDNIGKTSKDLIKLRKKLKDLKLTHQ